LLKWRTVRFVRSTIDVLILSCLGAPARTLSQEEPTIAGALAAATHFGLKAPESKKILREVFNVVAGWHKTGKQLRVKAATLDAYASAFDHSLMNEAGRLIGK